jgi:hypothetical protein
MIDLALLLGGSTRRDGLWGSLAIDPVTMSARASSIVGEPAIGEDAIERTTRHVWLVDHYGVLAIRSSEPQRHLARRLEPSDGSSGSPARSGSYQ